MYSSEHMTYFIDKIPALTQAISNLGRGEYANVRSAPTGSYGLARSCYKPVAAPSEDRGNRNTDRSQVFENEGSTNDFAAVQQNLCSPRRPLTLGNHRRRKPDFSTKSARLGATHLRSCPQRAERQNGRMAQGRGTIKFHQARLRNKIVPPELFSSGHAASFV